MAFFARFRFLRCVLPAFGWLWLAAPAAAQGPVPVPGLPSWEWQAPRPTGFDLKAVHAFDDQAAVAVGDLGTALKTTDQGRTWRPLNVGTRNDLKSVSFASPLVGWVAYNTPPTGQPNSQTGRGELRKTTDGGLTWTVQPIGEPSDVEMHHVHFFSATTGYVFYFFNQPSLGRPGRLRFTTDGGQTWTPRPIVGLTSAVQFLTPLLGYRVGFGGVGKTTDGGLTFTSVDPDPAIYFTQVYFVDARNGFVAGDYRSGSTPTTAPNMYRTTDGGATWTPMGPNAGTSNYLFTGSRGNLNFADPLHGTLGGLVTADGGQTWLPGQGIAQYGVDYGATRLRPSGVGFSVGYGGGLRVSTDFGRTTRRLTDSTAALEINTIRFPDPVRGWAVVNASGKLRVARTADRGTTWQTLDLAASVPGVDWPNVFYLRAAFPDADTAFVVSYSQLSLPPFTIDHFVLKTTNGGQSWTRLPYPGTAYIDDIQFRDARHGLLVGEGGRTWRTQDGGQTWAAGQRGTTKNLRVVSWADAHTAYAVGDSLAFVRTTDAGLTWQPVNTSFFTTLYATRPGWQWSLGNICFTSSRVGFYAYSYNNQIYRTADGGQTWVLTTVNNLVGTQGYTTGVSFITPRKGFAYGRQAYQTTDGGLTWSGLADMFNVVALTGAPVDRYNAWMAGDKGSILHYSEKFITATPLAQTAHCAGGSLALAFSTTGTFPTAEQRFKVELSNTRGRFRPGQIRVVGQGTASPLAVTLPLDLPAGSAYRLRVVQADSLVLGADTGQDLTINAAPTATLAPAGPQTLCAGRTLTLSAPAGQAQYLWSTGATTRTLTVTVGGSYTVRLAGAAGCFGPPSAAVAVTTAPVPATPVIQQSPGGQLSVAAVANATYQWSNAGGAIAGATAATYPATGAAPVGTYTVVVTSAAGCASAPSAPRVVILATRSAVAADFSLYPNPTNARLVIELPPGSGTVQLTLTDALGRVVLTTTSEGPHTTLDVRTLPEGTYTLRTTVPGGKEQAQTVLIAR